MVRTRGKWGERVLDDYETITTLTESHAAGDLGTASRPLALPPAPREVVCRTPLRIRNRGLGSHGARLRYGTRASVHCHGQSRCLCALVASTRHGPTRGRGKCRHPDRSATARFLRRRCEAEIPLLVLLQVGAHHRPPTRPIRRLARQRPELPRCHHRLRPSRPPLAPGHGPRRRGQPRHGEETVQRRRDGAPRRRERARVGKAQTEVREKGEAQGRRGAQAKSHSRHVPRSDPHARPNGRNSVTCPVSRLHATHDSFFSLRRCFLAPDGSGSSESTSSLFGGGRDSLFLFDDELPRCRNSG